RRSADDGNLVRFANQVPALRHAHATLGVVHDVTGLAQERADARAGEDGRAGRAEAERNEVLEAAAEQAAVAGAERQHQAEDGDAEAEAERTDVDERAARDDQRAERAQDERRQVRGRADPALHEVRDRAAAEAEPEDAGQEDAEPDETQPDELGTVVRPRLSRRAALLDAARRLRGRLVGPLLARHDGHFALSSDGPPS